MILGELVRWYIFLKYFLVNLNGLVVMLGMYLLMSLVGLMVVCLIFLSKKFLKGLILDCKKVEWKGMLIFLRGMVVNLCLSFRGLGLVLVFLVYVWMIFISFFLIILGWKFLCICLMLIFMCLR